MSGYVKHVKHAQDFDGQSVELTMTPLTVEDILHIRSVGADQNAFLSAIVPVLRRHVTGIVPAIKDADGTELSTEEVLSSAYFTQLIVNAGIALVQSATPKNPQQPAR
jgi:hypothetical protein